MRYNDASRTAPVIDFDVQAGLDADPDVSRQVNQLLGIADNYFTELAHAPPDDQLNLYIDALSDSPLVGEASHLTTTNGHHPMTAVIERMRQGIETVKMRIPKHKIEGMSLGSAKVSVRYERRFLLREPLFLHVCLLFVYNAHSSLAVDARETKHPNVLFIAIDDLNDWVGCLNGHPQAHTPNLDRLAQRGILFTNAHCVSPACNPSRAAVFSGVLPWNSGVWSNASKKLFQQRPDMQVLPRAFRDSGYVTLGTGKLMHSSEAANRVMFDHHFNVEQRWSPFSAVAVRYTEKELPSKGSEQPRHLATIAGADPVILPLNRLPSDRNPNDSKGESFDWGPLNVPDSAMGDMQITDWAIEKLKTQFDKPVFLGAGYYRPHIPLWAPEKYFERFQGQAVQLPPYLNSDLVDLSATGKQWALEAITAGLHSTVVKHQQWQEAVKAYLACSTFVDAQVGRLLDALDQSPYGDNTIIVLWSDHGWHLGEKQHWGKWTGWERSTRVPLIVVPSKRLAAEFGRSGSRCDEPVSLLDIYPTLAQLCSVRAPDSLDGRSLVPLLVDPERHTNRVVVTSFDPGNVSLRSDRWRFIRYADGSEELYDLIQDLNEWTNLVGEPEQQNLIQQYRRMIPPAALQNDDK